ncbi:MAG: phosphatidylserine/phosphatidylglycerophosphate/cardiolipin synthase family protein [Cyanobacteria bacterium P01_D01_bin.105]
MRITTSQPHQRKQLRWGFLCFFAVGSSFWLLPRLKPFISERELQPIVTALPQDPYIQAYFNQSQASVYTDPYRNIPRHGDDLEKRVISAIDQATVSVDIAVQAFELPLVAEALVRSAQRGVNVRFILENQYATALSPSEPNSRHSTRPNAALALLRDASVPILDDTADGSKGSGLMHHKFVIVDNRWVLTGSANFTYSGIHGDLDEPKSRGNANALLKIDSSAIASQFTAEFNQMWGDGPNQQPDSKFGLQKHIQPAQRTQLPTGTVTVQFSPLSSTKPWELSTNGFIARELSKSQNNIDIALFVFSDQNIANQLQNQVAARTKLRVLIDPTFVYRSYSEALDMLGVTLADQRCKIEANNQPWQVPIKTVGSPQLSPGDKLHHKFAVIDHKTILIGSHNWSQAANNLNDETLLIIQNPTVAAHFSREFERLQHQSRLGSTPTLKRKIEEAQKRCR